MSLPLSTPTILTTKVNSYGDPLKKGPPKRLSKKEMQAKNRLLVKRCYYKKRELLVSQREQVAQLESELAAALEAWKLCNHNVGEEFRQGERCITFQDLFSELTVSRCALAREQQQLKLQLEDCYLFRKRLLQLHKPRPEVTGFTVQD
jgi:hypothetical protein